MKRSTWLAFALAFVAPAVPTMAQEDSAVTARLESSRIAFGETVDLVISIEPSGGSVSIGEPDLSDVPAVIVGRSKASQVEVSGTRVRRTVVHRYRLRPLAPGTIELPPIEITIGERVVTTSALTLEVIDAGSRRFGRRERAPDGGPPPFFVTARVDRDRVFVGQQLTLTFAFYHDPNAPLTESPDYVPPETPGFWRVELDADPALSTERIGGRAYRVQRFDYALFPLRPGAYSIGPAAVRIVEPDRDVWWRAGGVRTLRTDPLQVIADPLPSGAPPGFDGAVGRYRLAGRVDRRSATVGVPIELELSVRGVGNPNAIGVPDLPAWPDIDAGAPTVETDTDIVHRTVNGEARLRYLLSPRSPGTIDLGTVRLSFFDADSGVYAADSITLGEIEVAPRGTPTELADRRLPAGPTLREARSPRSLTPHPLAGSRLWAGLAAPWLILLAVGMLARVRGRRGRMAEDRGSFDALVAAADGVRRGEPGAARRALVAIDAAQKVAPGWSPAADRAAARARVALNRFAYGGQADPGVADTMDALIAALGRRSP